MIEGIVVGFIVVVTLIVLGAVFVGYVLDRGFENREDPDVLKKWKQDS